MAKYRLVEHTGLDEHWYEIEYRDFLFWCPVEDIWGPKKYSSFLDAKHEIDKFRYGNKRKVIKRIEEEQK